MMSNRGGSAKQWAVAQNTFTASGSASLSPALSGGQVGKPIEIEVSGSVAGYVTLTYGNNSQVVVLVNPNAPYTSKAIPSTAFPALTNSVSVTATASGAGVITVAIGFQ